MEGECDRPLVQDRARVPREELQGRHVPGGDDQADGQEPAGGGADGREKYVQ